MVIFDDLNIKIIFPLNSDSFLHHKFWRKKRYFICGSVNCSLSLCVILYIMSESRTKNVNWKNFYDRTMALCNEKMAAYLNFLLFDIQKCEYCLREYLTVNINIINKTRKKRESSFSLSLNFFNHFSTSSDNIFRFYHKKWNRPIVLFTIKYSSSYSCVAKAVSIR